MENEEILQSMKDKLTVYFIYSKTSDKIVGNSELFSKCVKMKNIDIHSLHIIITKMEYCRADILLTK